MGLELEDGFVPLPKIRLTPTPLILTLFPLLPEITKIIISFHFKKRYIMLSVCFAFL